MYLLGGLSAHAIPDTLSLLSAHRSPRIHSSLRRNGLLRMLSVAAARNSCLRIDARGVGFLAAVQGLFRPHYMTWSEQQTIEFNGPRLLSCLTKFSRLGSDLFQVKIPRSTARNLRIRRRTA